MTNDAMGCIGFMLEEQDEMRTEVCKAKLKELTRQLLQGDTPQEIRNNLKEAKAMLNNINGMFDFILGVSDDQLTDHEAISNGIMEIFKERLV
jgi:hypothetical protein